MKPLAPLALVLAFACLFAMLGLGISFARTGGGMFTSGWTRSYQLYKQPHAIWLDQYSFPGANLSTLQKALQAAQKAGQTPEFVVYAIPMRDLGQSSEGGFNDYEDYMEDNRQSAERIKKYVATTGVHPHVYLEPDSIPLAVQYRRDNNNNPESMKIYNERVNVTRRLIKLYKDAGARVYLEAGHSGWFDYSDEDVMRIAKALNEAGIETADGVATNVSNRQPVTSASEKNELHYLRRLLPLLHKTNLDVVVDTSRNGGYTKARVYYLEKGGKLYDNEFNDGRLVGSWKRDLLGEIWLQPFFGPKKPLSRLTSKEKYKYNDTDRLLTAPAWLDAVGDVKTGPAPTDSTPPLVSAVIKKYRYIKPPDDCDGALNCPPGWSKEEINRKTAERQVQGAKLSLNWE